MLREEKLPFPLYPETGSIWNMSKNNNDDDDKKPQGTKRDGLKMVRGHNRRITIKQ